MHHWHVILSITSEMGPMYHMDFSENISHMHKFEPQSSHFNKAQYSLHCTVRHGANGSLITIQHNTKQNMFLIFGLLLQLAEKEIIDDYHQTIQNGSVYLKCHYLEKVSEKRSKVGYQLLSKNVFILPSQVMNSLVEMTDKLELSITEYQWLLDII